MALAQAVEPPTDSSAAQGKTTHSIRFWLFMVGAVTAAAGLLFGYDQGVISGALDFIKEDFHLSTTLVQVVTSWVALGALVGAATGGWIADSIGRRRAGMLGGVLFIVGALIQAFSLDTGMLVLGRFVIGSGVGVASVAAPLYAAEMAPSKLRGRFVSTYQLAITMGILFAYIVDAILTRTGNWRLMLGVSAVVGVLLVIGMFVVPETARWLIRQKRSDEARQTLEKVRPAELVDEKLQSIAGEIDEEEVGRFRELFQPALRRPLYIGVTLAILQQVTGINAIIYYADEIFADAGFTSVEAQADATLVAVGVVNVLATLIAVAFIDKVGRRPLLFAGLTGMFVALTGAALAFLFIDPDMHPTGPSVLGIATMACVVVFIASFAFSMGPITWTIINEIYPTRIRGKAVALATSVNWLGVFLVSQFFLTFVDTVGTSVTFGLFAAMTVLTFLFVLTKVPETKGYTLEEISGIWESPAGKRPAPAGGIRGLAVPDSYVTDSLDAVAERDAVETLERLGKTPPARPRGDRRDAATVEEPGGNGSGG